MKTFKLRAETPRDIAELLQAIDIVTMSYTRDPVYFGIEVMFTSDWPLAKIKSAISQIEDGHVMFQTVNLANEYTGERKESGH